MKVARGTVIAILAVGLLDSGVGAQNNAQMLEEMLKWQTAKTVHYDVVAEYTGEAVVLRPGGGAPVVPYPAQVKDRYEISFDWNPVSMALVGKPVFKNFPASLPQELPARTVLGRPCPPPKMSGTFDYVEVLEARTGQPGTNSLELSEKRSHPAGAIPYPGDGPCNGWFDTPASIETVTDALVVPSGKYFAMPAAVLPKELTVGNDHKTMTRREMGWTYTYTPRIVN